MNEDETLPILEEYDDGVVCFGPVTESQLERFKKLPRHTIIPSNFKLSQSFVGKDQDEDPDDDEFKENINIDDSVNTIQSANNLGNAEKTGLIKLKQSFMSDNHHKSSILLDKSKENTTINIDSSVNVTLSTTHDGEEEKTGTIELKQSFVNDFTYKSTSIILTEPNANTTININSSVNTSRSTTYHGEEETGTTESNQSCIKDSPYKSTSILLAVPEENSILFIDNSVNTTQSTTYIEEEVMKKTSSIKSKQSLIKDSTSEFSSPSANQFIPSDNFIDTDVINRYIRMGSLSSNESFSEDQDISTFDDETHSYIDVQEAQFTPNDSTNNESISTEQSSILSVIQRSVSEDQKSISDIADNVCTLKHCSQNEDNDLSVDGGSELEDSITTDEYSVTPGKKRLFDMRLAKPSFRAKIVATAAPFMDRIEESTTPGGKSFNSSSVLFNDVSNKSLETEKNLDLSTVTNISRSSSVMHFNQSSDEYEFESTKCVSRSSNDALNDTRKSIVMNMEVEPENTRVVGKEMHNELAYLENISVSTVDFDVTQKVDETLMDTTNASTHEFYNEKSTNIIVNTANPITEYNAVENSVVMDVEMKSNNTSIVDGVFDTTVSSNKLSMNISTCFEPLNKTKPTEDYDVADKSIDLNNMTNVMFTRLPMSDISMIVNDQNDKLKSTEVESNLTTATIVDEVLDDTTYYTNTFSTNDKSMNLNETKLTEDISNVSAHLSDMEKSVYLKPNMILSKTEVNETSKLNLSVNDCRKNSIDKIYHAEKLEHAGDVSSHVTKHLDFGQTMYELCNNISSTSSIIKSNDFIDQCRENVSMLEQTNLSETFSPVGEDGNNFSVSETPLRSNLSVIIENRTLEENESPVSTSSILENTVNELVEDIEMRKSIVNSVPEMSINKFENSINDVPTTSVSENIVNEIQDVEILDKSTNLSKRESIVSVPELSINKIENSINNVPTTLVSENIVNETQDVEILDKSTNLSKRESIVSVQELSINKFENSINDLPTTSVSENIVNETQDVEILDKSTNLSKRESIVSVHELSINKFENSINNVPTTLVSENIVNETQDVEILDKSTNQSKRESINSVPELSINKIENSINDVPTTSVSENMNETQDIRILNNSINQSMRKSFVSIVTYEELENPSNNVSMLTENTVNENQDKEKMLNKSRSDNKRMSIVVSVPKDLFENVLDNVPTISVSENITNETQDVEILDESTNQIKRESFVVSVPELSINKFENSVNDVPTTPVSENMNETLGIRINSTNQSMRESFVSIVTNEELENPTNNMSMSTENTVNENQDKEDVLNELKNEGETRGSIVASVPEVMVENLENFIDNGPTTSVPENIVNEIQDVEMLNQSTNQSKRESINIIDTSKSEMIEFSVADEAGTLGMETKSNEVILTNSNSVLPLVKNDEAINNTILDDVKHNVSSMVEELQAETKLNNLTKEENQSYDIVTEKILVSENVKEMVLNCNTDETFTQNGAVIISNLSTFDIMPESENSHKSKIDNQEQNVLLNNNQQQGLLNLSENVNYEEQNKLKYKTPKTQKLVDFSFVQQTPATTSKIKKQKLLDFSIVHQTPTSNIQVKNRKLSNFSIVDQTAVGNMLHQTSLCENITKKDNLMDFSSVNQIWNLETVSPDVFDNDLQSTLGDFSSNNLSTISLPNVELYADESIITNSSSPSNSKFDQTITEADLNQSTFPCEFNEAKTSTNQIGMIINSVPSTSLKKTNECLDSKEIAEKIQSENIQCMLVTDSSQQGLKFNKQAIMDFSIIEQQILQTNKDKIINETVKSDESNVNLIEMSMAETKPNKQVPSGIPVTSVTTNNKLMVSSDGSSNTVVRQEEYAHNTELITDMQMDDVSLLTDSPEKSCTSESFHSIEMEHVQDNKRKIEPVQEYQNNDKRMKVESEESKTPSSMLYKIRNMFRSSEKKSYYASNTKENNLNLDGCHKKLNFSKLEENTNNFTKPPHIQSIKSEIPVKSKIPCKVTDRSMMKTDELNGSSLLLNDSVKVKKTIPKFIGNPVLSDVSNSSMRKCPESRIPSKFHK